MKLIVFIIFLLSSLASATTCSPFLLKMPALPQINETFLTTCFPQIGENAKLKKSLLVLFKRYQDNAEVKNLAKLLSSRTEIELSGKLQGDMRVVYENNTIHYHIPIIQLRSNSSELLQLGEYSDHISTEFSKLMTSISLSALEKAHFMPELKQIKITGHAVVNERLAGILSDLGFHPLFVNRRLTAEELKTIYQDRKIPPTLEEFVDWQKVKEAKQGAGFYTEEQGLKITEEGQTSVTFELSLIDKE